MEPVRTAASNLVYRAPPGSVDVEDAWTEVTSEAVYLVWEPTQDERDEIAAGANLRLGIFVQPIPPVSLGTAFVGRLTDEGAGWVDRARNELKRRYPAGIKSVAPGFWEVSTDVWDSLNTSGALDTRGVPSLVGRPLMVDVDDRRTDVLEYRAADQPTAEA